MDIDDKELFDSAITDEPVPEATEQPAPQEAPQQQDGQARDEHGRFAARQASEPQTEPQQAPAEQGQAREDGAHVPSWRLREERERAEAIERRYNDERMQWQRQFETLQRQMPKPEPKPVPDLFENPNGFVDHNVQERLTPIEQRLQAQEARMQAQLEFVSRRDAFKEHGEPTVRSAYDWVANGVKSQDPDVVHTYNRAMQSEHPYDAIVQAYKRASVMQQINQVGDIDKWVMQRAQELSGQQQSQQRQQSNGQPQGSITKLPPSLRNTPAARAAVDDDNDMSDAALFRHATR